MSRNFPFDKVRLVEGLCLEDITQRLGDAGVIHSMSWGPFVGLQQGYIRASSILVNLQDKDAIIDILGQPNTHRKQETVFSYFGYYNPRRNFDKKVVTGLVRYNKGRFMEKTEITLGGL